MSTEELPIKMITLYFPEGITVKQAEKIALDAEKATNNGITSGGFTPNMHMDEFSKDTMLFQYSPRKPKK